MLLACFILPGNSLCIVVSWWVTGSEQLSSLPNYPQSTNFESLVTFKKFCLTRLRPSLLSSGLRVLALQLPGRQGQPTAGAARVLQLAKQEFT